MQPSGHKVDQTYEHIIREGAWTRCAVCSETAAQKRATAGLLPDRRFQNAMADITAAGESVPTVTCTKCQKERPYIYFPVSTLKNKDRDRTHVCGICRDMQFCIECKEWKDGMTGFRAGQVRCKMCQYFPCTHCSKDLGHWKKASEFHAESINNAITH